MRDFLNDCIVGVDIGGTTYSSSVFNNELELIKTSTKEQTSLLQSPGVLIEAIVNQISSLVDKDCNLIGVGISSPGPLDSVNGKILNTPNLPILQNLELKKELESRLDLPVHIENDANLFALGEWYKASSSEDEIFGALTLGTGLGFGIIINGKIFSGAHGLASEYAISPLDSGNWEDKVSISALKKISIKYLNISDHEPKIINDLAISGDKNAKRVWLEFGENLGMALSHFINLIDPHTISIGGGLSHGMRFFKDSMESSLNSNSPAYQNYDIKIYESKYKELSSQLGAAMIVKRYHQSIKK